MDIYQERQEVAGESVTSFFVDMDDERLDHTLRRFCKGNTEIEEGYGEEAAYLLSCGLLEGSLSNGKWDEELKPTAFGRQFNFEGGFTERAREMKFRKFIEIETINQANKANAIAIIAVVISLFSILISLLV